MGIARDYKKIQEIASAYRQELVKIPETSFRERPPFGGWSCSEVCFHIFDASILSIGAMKRAANGEGKEGSVPFIVKLILFADRLPPGMKFKAPAVLQERLKFISKEEAAAMIDEMLIRLDEVYPKLASASRSSKTKHPVIGYLNSRQWLRFTEIHLKHHLKQLKRIISGLGI